MTHTSLATFDVTSRFAIRQQKKFKYNLMELNVVIQLTQLSFKNVAEIKVFIPYGTFFWK